MSWSAFCSTVACGRLRSIPIAARRWLLLAIGCCLWQPAFSQEPSEPPVEVQAETAPDSQEGEPAGDQDAAPEQERALELLAPIQGIEAAIRDLVAEQRRAAGEEPDEHEIRDLKAQEEMARSAFWMLVAAWASVALTLIGVLLIWRTLKATREAANYAKSASDAAWETVDQAKQATAAALQTVQADRAWMLYNHTMGVPNGDREDPDKTIGFEFTMLFRNSGRSPAVRATVDSNLYTINPEDSLPKVPAEAARADKDLVGNAGPGDHQGGQSHFVSLADLHRNIAGEIQHILFARISYEDIWGETHMTEASVYIFVRVPAEVLTKKPFEPGAAFFYPYANLRNRAI